MSDRIYDRCKAQPIRNPLTPNCAIQYEGKTVRGEMLERNVLGGAWIRFIASEVNRGTSEETITLYDSGDCWMVSEE
jgi:hypothetical protein